MSEQNIQKFINKTRVYNNLFENLFFRTYADRILQSNLGKFLLIKFEDEQATNGTTKQKTKIYKITSVAIKLIIDFYRKGL